ncbi:MAG: DUF5106 domain-containing protein [Muribaculaceae bacterium]|nr:DUF5106 domain-containing protein [Muribaculaceae bacterium]
MKRIFSILLTIIGLMSASAPDASAKSGDLFIYPVPPDSMQMLQSRCDYIVTRFWDRCNFGTAFDKYPEQLNAAFGDWVAIMPHASADSVHVAIDRLLKRFEKKGPETLALATMAENWLYSDTADYTSEEAYLPFAKAAATHKKIGKADRARFESQARIIESSSVGARVPAIPFTRADGSKGTLDDVRSGSVLLFFNDPDCLDCTMARIRLSADPNTAQLIERGELSVVSIYPGETDDDNWEKAKASTHPSWVTVAMPEAYDYFDLRSTPLFVFLNSRHKVLASGLDIDHLLNAFMVSNQATLQKKANEQPAE